MANQYKSKVTNKYMGSTFAGQVRYSKETPLSDIVNAINRNTGKFENFANKYIDGKKEVADKYLSGYYATGGTPEKLNEEILNGQHPELQNMYAESAIDGHNGRFVATEIAKQIELQGDSYNHLEQSWEEWVAQLKDSNGTTLMPSMEGKSSAFANGFALTFGEYRAQSLLKDAENRADYWNEKKMTNAVQWLDGQQVIFGKDGETYWANLQSLNTRLPDTDGTGKQFYFTNEEMNDVALRHANYIYTTATTDADLERAITILTSDRGVGSGGNNLGSLIDTKREDVAALVEQINQKKVRLKNQNRADLEYEEKTKTKDLFIEGFKTENKSFEKQEEIYNKLLAINPAAAMQFMNLKDKSRFVMTDPTKIDQFTVEVISGVYKEPEDVIKAMVEKGIPTDKASTMLSFWATWSSNDERGMKPIHQTNSTYVEQMSSIDASIKGLFTTTNNMGASILKETAYPVLRKVKNYMITEINTFETEYFKTHGKEPSEEERREHMMKIGAYLEKTYGKGNEVDSENLIPMTNVEKQNKENEKKKEAIDAKAEELSTTVTSNLENMEIDIPTVDKNNWYNPKEWIIDDEKKSNVKRNIYIRDNIQKALGDIEINEEFIKELQNNFDAYLPILDQLVEAFGFRNRTELMDVMANIANNVGFE